MINVTAQKTTINHGCEKCFEKNRTLNAENECFFLDTRKYYERREKMQSLLGVFSLLGPKNRTKKEKNGKTQKT